MTIAQLAEAQFGNLSEASKTGKSWKIKIIEGDRQGSSAYYPKEALEKGAHLFKAGTRIYLNHPSSEAKWSQPERRAEDIIGVLSEDATFDGKDLFGNAEFFEEHQAFIKSRAEKGVIAMSIRAEGQMVETARGLELQEFTTVHSVDVVTVGGAGGGFEKLLESARNENNSQAAKLAEAQKEETELELPKEFLNALEGLTSGVNALNESLAAEKKAREDKAVEEAAALEEAGKVKAPTATEIAGALLEAKLSDKAGARVLAAVEAGTDLTEAVKAEKDIAAEYLAEAAANAGGGHIDDELSLTESQKLEKAFSGIYGN
jgi:hypothetical protein